MGKRKAEVYSPSHEVRWMIKRDMPTVLAIEAEAFEFPWCEMSFIRAMRQRNCIGMVIEDLRASEVRGFMIYELHKNRLHILNIAVDAAHRGRGYGRWMVQRLTNKLSHERRNRIMTEVRETNVDAQLFFRAMNFRAISVLKDFYDDTNEDAYLFQYRHKPTEEEIISGANRITRMAG